MLMDPNARKKNLLNKLNKDQALERLYNENFKRVTASFYKYVILEDPQLLRDSLFHDWSELKVFGRIYLAHEGINAQLSCPKPNWDSFVMSIRSIKEFEPNRFAP